MRLAVRHSTLNRDTGRAAFRRKLHDRSGALLLELVVGAVLLGVFLGTVGPMFRWLHESKRFNDRRLIAIQELSTQMESLAAMSPAELTAERLQLLTVSGSTAATLPELQLAAKLQADGEFMQRVTLTLSWTGDSGTAVEPEQLTAWFPRESKGESE